MRVDGIEIEIVDQIRFDENGKICEFTVFFRPMPAIAVAMRLIAAGLLARRSKFISTISSVLMRPLAVIIRAGDRIGVRLVKSTF